MVLSENKFMCNKFLKEIKVINKKFFFRKKNLRRNIIFKQFMYVLDILIKFE